MKDFNEFSISETEIDANNVKSAPDELAAEGEVSTRDVKHIFDKLPELIAKKLNDFVNAVAEKFAEHYTKTEVDEIIVKRIEESGNGDMVRDVYDTTHNGIVDNAEKVCGFWFSKTDAEGSQTSEIYIHWIEDENGNVVGTVPIT